MHAHTLYTLHVPLPAEQNSKCIVPLTCELLRVQAALTASAKLTKAEAQIWGRLVALLDDCQTVLQQCSQLGVGGQGGAGGEEWRRVKEARRARS